MRKQLFYLTNTELTARQWQAGKLSDGQTFQNDEAGWQALAVYLEARKHVPIFILLDLIEEDFHRDTMPHVFGTTRRNLIERRLQQLYRDTPFRHASHQGREKTGRKDDVMLFNALTNAPLLKPWIDTILSRQVPVAGMFSTALLSTALYKKIQLGKEPVLFITHQSAGLRQSFFYNGYLRFSRLTKLPDPDADSVAEVARVEIGKTRLFLANTRQLQRGESLTVVVLANSGTLQSMQAMNLGSDGNSYRFVQQDEAQRILGIKQRSSQPVLDALLLTMLARTTPASHYALLEQSHAYALWKSRIILYVLSGATVAGCVFWSGANVLEAIDEHGQYTQLIKETARDEQRYQRIVESMPKTDVNPHDMKSAVDLHELIAQHNSTPKTMLMIISQALDRIPQLNLDELSWEVSDQTGATNPAEPPAANGAVSATLIGVPAKPAEIVMLKGEVLPFENDYRTALERVSQFSNDLMKNKHIQVSALKLPLDIRSSATLNGEAGNPDNTTPARFELKITWSP